MAGGRSAEGLVGWRRRWSFEVALTAVIVVALLVLAPSVNYRDVKEIVDVLAGL